MQEGVLENDCKYNVYYYLFENCCYSFKTDWIRDYSGRSESGNAVVSLDQGLLGPWIAVMGLDHGLLG